tara:strand:- start:9653 stop:11581 length:1929 start_codon:yes stop_codon:yes gene_type:complete
MTREKYLRACEDDFTFWCQNEVKIRPKQKVPGGLIKLDPNPGQAKIINVIDDLETSGKPAWIITLKHRQWGSSTLFQAYAMHKCRFTPYLEALVIGDRERTTRKLMAMNRRMLENLSPVVMDGWERTIDRTDSHYEWSNGSILSIDTAGQAQAARGITADFVHGSEAAFWPNGDKLISAMTPAVAESAGSMFVLESTSAGAFGIFWEIWESADNPSSQWTKIFVPWTTHPEYDDTSRIDPELRKLGIRASEGDETALKDLKDLTKEELEWVVNGDMNIGQAFWRRRTVATRFMGKEEEFSREYPSTAEEAFRSAANEFLNDHGKKVQRQAKSDEYSAYDIEVFGANLHETDKISTDGDPLLEYLDNEPEFRPELEEVTEGWIHVFEEPEEGETYIVGVDPSEGTGNDYASFAVRCDDEIVACGYRNDMSTDVFAMYLDTLGRWYNGATLHIERAGGGLAVINTLIRLHYPYLYGTEAFDEHGESKGRRVGFTPTADSVKSLLAMLRHELNTGGLLLKHPRALMECGWVRRVVRRRADETLVAEWKTPGKGRDMPSGEKLSDDLFRAAALTVMPARDSAWQAEMAETHAGVGAPEMATESAPHFEYHNPLFEEFEEGILIQDGNYDTFEITPELDGDIDLPLP